MAKLLADLSVDYATRTTAPSTEFPHGSYKNLSTVGADDGTPFEKEIMNQEAVLPQWLCERAQMEPSGVSETVNNSQYGQSALMNFAANSRPPHASLDDVCAGLPGIAWHDPRSALNALETSHVFRDACLVPNKGGHDAYLLAVTDAGTIYPITGLWDSSASPSIGSAFGFVYPDTLEGVWSICCDGSAVYILWSRTSDSALFVSKYTISASGISGSAAEWTTASLGITSEYSYPCAIVADSSNVAVSWYDIVGTYTCPGVAIITKSTGDVTWGQGNNGTASKSTDDGANFHGRIVSDGDHIFWITRTGTSGTAYTYVLASAKISDPTTSDYSLASIVSGLDPATEMTEAPAAILDAGRTIAVIHIDGTIKIFDKPGDSLSSDVLSINGFSAAATTLAYDIIATSDGMNAWVAVRAATSTTTIRVFKIPLGVFDPDSPASAVSENSYLYCRYSCLGSLTPSNEFREGKLLFDTQSIIMARRTGDVYRIMNPQAV